jgi:hypothetical protein
MTSLLNRLRRDVELILVLAFETRSLSMLTRSYLAVYRQSSRRLAVESSDPFCLTPQFAFRI